MYCIFAKDPEESMQAGHEGMHFVDIEEDKGDQ